MANRNDEFWKAALEKHRIEYLNRPGYMPIECLCGWACAKWAEWIEHVALSLEEVLANVPCKVCRHCGYKVSIDFDRAPEGAVPPDQRSGCVHEFVTGVLP